MALADHLRELRARLIRSALFLLLAFFVALFFYEPTAAARRWCSGPTTTPSSRSPARRETTAYVASATGPLMLQLKLCGVAAIVISSPYWLYQIWGFIVPGLHPQRAQVVADLRGRRRAAVHHRRASPATTCCPRASRC